MNAEQVFDLLNSRLADLIGTSGRWTLVRRTDADTDQIFHQMLTHQIATELTHSLLVERSSIRGEAAPEPAALSWMPEPIAVWADHDLPITLDPEPIGELLDTTDTDEHQVVPARHAADSMRLVA
ncbi:hypothetical protein [Rathayibacter sp. YIM 133350]|uniref:hypothetical protein n=1 Tax=Rathayibacter sp. YIM 133350 TaxID=3131992 RepID=UPI00307FBBAC